MKRFVLLVTLFCSAAAYADINVTLTAGAAGATPVATGLTPMTTITGNTRINVTCGANVDCSFVAVKVGASGSEQSIPLSTGAATRSGTIPLAMVSSSGTPLRILAGASGDAVSAGVTQLVAAPANAGGAASPTPNAQQPATPSAALVVVQTPCDRVRFNPSYSRSGNRAHMVVTTGGSILQYPGEPIDEDDVVVLHVVGTDESMLQNIEVSRVSATRTTGDLSVIGGGTTGINLQSSSNTCYERQFELSDFAPGEGKVEIATVSGAQRTVTGTVTFTVDRLWDGILSIGPAWSRVVDDSFGLAANAAGQNVIINTEAGRDDVTYIVQYTQFMWGRRDVEKTYPLREHFNPSIGFAVSNLKENAFAGLTFDWKQFLFTAGVRAAHVTRLAAGTTVGSTFTGAADTIPTEKKWQTGVFFGVTVDVRAVKALLGVVGK